MQRERFELAQYRKHIFTQKMQLQSSMQKSIGLFWANKETREALNREQQGTGPWLASAKQILVRLDACSSLRSCMNGF
jgi:hypothetical protein